MLKSYLKISIRYLVLHRLYSAINILGLAVGLTSVLLIFLFVRHELSFDRYHPDAERTYRLSMEFDSDNNWASNIYALVPALLETMPEIEAGARLMGTSIPVQQGQVTFNEDGLRLADPAFFELFSFEWKQGNPSTALNEPFTVVLTESMARKYFGTQDPMGQSLTLDNQVPVLVTGVIADLPDNTHLSADFFTAMQTGIVTYGENYLTGAFNFHSYIRLREGVDIQSLSEQITTLLLSRMEPAFQGRTRVIATQLPDLHFVPMRNELSGTTPGSMALVYTFSAIALGILVIACINFVNLSTARSSQRAKEVGMRKSIGAARAQIICQFLGEAIILAILSMVLAVVLVELLLPVFSTFTGKELVFGLFSNPQLLAWLMALAVLIGILAGAYPAFYLSAFKPARVLKGNVTRGNAGLLFRNVLVVCQFSIAIALIVSFAVIHAQLQYATSMDPGYDKEQILIMQGSTTENLGSQWETMQQELLSHPEIVSVTASSTVPGPAYGNAGWSIRYEGGTEPYDTEFMSVDFKFFETYGIRLLAGRTFNEDLGTDRLSEERGGAYILNAMAARQLGWTPEEAIGKWIEWGVENGPRGTLVGVVDDVYYASLKVPQVPLVYMVGRSQSQVQVLSFDFASLRLTGNNLPDTLDFIDATWAQFMPGVPIDRSFLDQNFEALYQTEQQQGELLSYFSLLAVFVACLGLYGLAVFNAERRTKEIGVRKVMGGSVWSIVVLLTNDFSKLVLLSNLIAWPVAYFAMSRWLENFAYRIDLTPLIFVGSGLIALCIAWVTVGGTAAKAANQKPVLALRYE